MLIRLARALEPAIFYFFFANPLTIEDHTRAIRVASRCAGYNASWLRPGIIITIIIVIIIIYEFI